jgi:hypothetical protein
MAGFASESIQPFFHFINALPRAIFIAAFIYLPSYLFCKLHIHTQAENVKEAAPFAQAGGEQQKLNA